MTIVESGETNLFGYKHGHGVGARSLHIVVALSRCATEAAARIAAKNQNIQIVLPVACTDASALEFVSTAGIPDLVGHPNVASALLVASGCEVVGAREFMPSALLRNSALEFIVDGESNRSSITTLFGQASLSELSARSMPGFERFTGSIVGVILGENQDAVDALSVGLQRYGIEVIQREKSEDTSTTITELAMAGCLVIVNMLDDQESPDGFPLVPVINVSSGSAFHASISDFIDVANGADASATLDVVIATLGRQLTKVEMFGFTSLAKSVFTRGGV